MRSTIWVSEEKQMLSKKEKAALESIPGWEDFRDRVAYVTRDRDGEVVMAVMREPDGTARIRRQDAEWNAGITPEKLIADNTPFTIEDAPERPRARFRPAALQKTQQPPPPREHVPPLR
jgi:hypothetical protein